MKKKLFFGIAACFVFAFQLTAQKPKPEVVATSKAYTVVIPYLGHSDYKGGLIPKTAFDSLLKQGISARDSAGNFYPVGGFTFSYKQKNLYEDSVGNLIYITDFFSEYCMGDTMSAAIAENLLSNTRIGDTAYIDQVKVVDTVHQIVTKSAQFILTP